MSWVVEVERNPMGPEWSGLKVWWARRTRGELREGLCGSRWWLMRGMSEMR